MSARASRRRCDAFVSHEATGLSSLEQGEVYIARETAGAADMTLRMLVAAAIAAAIATPASAQTQRLRGEIQGVEGTTIFAKARDGSAVTVKLAENAPITAAY